MPARPLLAAKGALVASGYRQLDLAARLHVSQRYVNAVLNGREKPPQRFREALAELTGRPERELFSHDRDGAA
jgi:transcriptional regulator with XRE-family HTH domain